jgi:hypothetical protein
MKHKNINNPTTVTALAHLEEMYNNARIALVEGRPIMIIQTVDMGDHYITQDMCIEVRNDIIRQHNNATNTLVIKLLR